MRYHPKCNSHVSVLCCRILNPLVFGDYPGVMKKNAGSRLPAFTSLESQIVKGSCDFFGINYYNTLYVKDYSSILKTEKRDFNADSAIKIMRKFLLIYVYII